MKHSKSSGSDRRIAPSKAKAVGQRGRPTGDHEARRAELLTAAIGVTAEEGYTGASMRKVAKRAGCTTGAVTYYFASKEEMDIAVAHNLFDRFDGLLESSWARTDIRMLIEQWFDWAQVDDTDMWYALFQLLAHARHEQAFADIVQRRYKQFRRALTSKLAQGQSHGIIRNDIAADLLADQISAMSDGWMMLIPIDQRRFSPERVRALQEAVIVLVSPCSSGK